MDQQTRKHTSSSIRQIAKELRKNMTPEEKLLWERLRDYRLCGLKFRRQAPIGPYIADFYHADTKLVIEIDGGIHHDKVDSDVIRTKRFNDFGYTVIRFNNEEVEKNIESVLSKILEKISEIHSNKV